MENNEIWIDVQIEDKIYKLLVATTDEEKERGLMWVEELPKKG